ncbi:MAG: tRNA (adenosine(37)-N6)-threonylcarbamoyltransferase complex transferase subunit TsaD [Chlamydiota bacterium]
MNVLGIETTCDETAVAIVQDGKKILANEISSQVELHAAYGGVFPELASREHIDQVLPLVEKALATAALIPSALDLIAVAHGPGLMGSLLVGTTAATALAFGWNKPIIGVNHVEAHLYSALMGDSNPPLFPALGVVLSGGHTFLAHVTSPTNYDILATTVDDAVGEAFDKVAVLLNLSYPGGPAIEQLAQKGDPNRYSFKAGQVKNQPLAFSFSGLKTNVFYTVKDAAVTEDNRRAIAASFQRAAITDITLKISRALKAFPYRAVYFGGGVTANQALRDHLTRKNFSCPLYWPPLALTGDNGAMIAGLGFHLFRDGKQTYPTPFPRSKQTARKQLSLV